VGFLGRIKTAAKNLVSMVFGRQTIWWGSGYGGTRFDYARDTRPDLNSIVVAAVGWMARNFPEAPPRVSQRVGVELTAIPDHPLTQLLRRPNPFYSGVLLWIATVASCLMTGNAYWIKVRSGAGRVVEIWWIPSSMMAEKWPDDGSAFITHYDYKPDGRFQAIRVEIKDVVHFRYGLDPDNPRRGLSPFASLLREIFTDGQAANFSATILRNLGVPGVVITPDDTDQDIGPEAADKIKTDFKQRFGGDNRGEPLVLSGKTKVQVLSFSPEQMNLKDIRRIPEERISGVLGIPAIVAGLGAGLDHATYSNVAQAREAAFENGVIPLQRLFAEELRVQLLVDFADISRTEIDFDLSNVRVLQDDQDKRWKRLHDSLVSGGMLLNTYLRETGQQELSPELGDMLYVPKSVVPMKPDQLGQIEPAVPNSGTQEAPFAVPAPTTNGKVAVLA
jgi:HK97 family phage portal protein